MLPQIDRRGGCKRQKSQCGALLGCAPASGGCSARKAEFAVAVHAEEDPNGYRWGMVLRMALCGTKRQTVRRWRKEGQGGDVHAWERNNMDASSLHDDDCFTLRSGHVQCCDAICASQEIAPFPVAWTHTPACPKVRYRSVALSPGSVDGSGRRWCAGIPDTMMCCS